MELNLNTEKSESGSSHAHHGDGHGKKHYDIPYYIPNFMNTAPMCTRQLCMHWTHELNPQNSHNYSPCFISKKLGAIVSGQNHLADLWEEDLVWAKITSSTYESPIHTDVVNRKDFDKALLANS